MNKHFLKNVTIKNVRGIKDSTLEELSDVNLLLGENNGGKTSFLEAISLLGCSDAYDMINVSSRRSDGIEGIQYMFRNHSNSFSVSSKRNDDEELEVKAKYNLYRANFSKNMFLTQDRHNDFSSYLIDSFHLDGKEMPAISLELSINGATSKKDYLEADFLFGRVKQKVNLRERANKERIVYVSPSQHFKPLVNMVSKVLRSSDYTSITVALMRLIDPSLESISINIKPLTGEKDVYVKTKDEDPVPISLFGDGAKKALTLACYVAMAKDGILLIDEIETSLHHSLYSDVFAFLVKAAKQFNVQLFITTHSKEVIETFFDATTKEPERLRVYTIRKDKNDIFVRALDSDKAKEYQEMGIEVRG